MEYVPAIILEVSGQQLWVTPATSTLLVQKFYQIYMGHKKFEPNSEEYKLLYERMFKPVFAKVPWPDGLSVEDLLGRYGFKLDGDFWIKGLNYNMQGIQLPLYGCALKPHLNFDHLHPETSDEDRIELEEFLADYGDEAANDKG
jgi:hypothetical protein